MGEELTQLKDPQIRRLVETSHLLHRLGYVAGSEGNISLRVSEDAIFIKASEAVCRVARPEDFVCVDIPSGSSLGRKPSTELPLHLAVYRKRKDIKAIIHSHPSSTIAVSPFLKSLRMVEPSRDVEEVPVIRGYEPGSDELANAVASQFSDVRVKAVILERHGLVAAGETLDESFDLTQVIEKNAIEWEKMRLHELMDSIAESLRNIEKQLKEILQSR